jgi:glycosyltransferase involved in cell wall biosynthesis
MPQRAPQSEEDASDAAAQPLSWGLCVATLDRPEVLRICVEHALMQNRRPSEIVITDASDDWEEHRDQITGLVTPSGTRLIYQKAAKRSLTVQRNQGIREASADVLFLFDDDAFMLPGCAEAIMAVYEKDRRGKISCVAAAATLDDPRQADAPDISRKERSQASQRGGLSQRLPSGLKKFITKYLLLIDLEQRFIPYDAIGYGPKPGVPAGVSEDEVFAVGLVSGFRITVRRRVALIEKFDEGLIAYCPAEDLDATYRFLRHGANVVAKNARLYHHEAAASRLKRRKVAELSALNIAYFLRAKSKQLAAHCAIFYLWSLRMFASAALRDLVGRRWDFPDTMGTAAAISRSVSVFRRAGNDLLPWYEDVQYEILRSR